MAKERNQMMKQKRRTSIIVKIQWCVIYFSIHKYFVSVMQKLNH